MTVSPIARYGRLSRPLEPCLLRQLLADIQASQGHAWPTSLPAAPFATLDLGDGSWLRQNSAWRGLFSEVAWPMYSAQLIYLAGNNVWQNSLDSESAPSGTAAQIHLPLRPSPGGCLLVDGATIPLCPTEGWVVGGACRYDLRNPSPSALLHLVVRCAASDALLTELQAAPALVTPRTVAETFAHLCHYLLSDEALLRPFQHTDDTRQFVQCLINTAQALGYALTETDVVDAMRGSHHTWIKQWIV